MKNTEIPADRSSYNSFTSLTERVLGQTLRADVAALATAYDAYVLSPQACTAPQGAVFICALAERMRSEQRSRSENIHAFWRRLALP